jgi:O-antigen ligase
MLRLSKQSVFPLLWALVLAEIFSVSLFFQGVHDTRISAVCMGLLVFGFASVVIPGFAKGWSIPRSGTALFLALFSLYMGVSVFWSSVPYISMMFVFIIGTLPFLFFSIIMAPDPDKMARVCFYAIGAVLAMVAVWALIQFFFISSAYRIRIHHPLLSPNNLGVMFAMSVLPALGLLMAARGRGLSVLYGLTVILFFAALLVTQSRGALLSLAISAPVFLAVTFRNGLLLRYKLPVILAVAVIIFIGFEVMTGSRITQSLERFENINQDFGLFGRLELWRATWQMAQDYFWSGTGLATFFYHYPAYRVPRETSDGFFAHMDPLQFWAEMGVLAPVLFYGFLIAVLLRTDRAMKAAKGQDGLRISIASAFCGLLILALHAHIDFHLYVLPILFPVAALLAFWYVQTERVLSPSRFEISALRARRGLALGVSILMLAGFVWIGRAGAGIWFVSEATDDLNTKNFAAAKIALDRGEFWAPDSYGSVYEYKGRLNLMLMERKDQTPEQKRILFEEGLAGFAESHKRNARNPYALNFEAILHYKAYEAGLAPEGDVRAIELLQQALTIDPLFIMSRQALANIYIAKGREREALALLKDGLPWPKPRQMGTIHYLIQTANLVKTLDNDKGMFNKIFTEAKNLNESIQARKKN